MEYNKQGLGTGLVCSAVHDTFWSQRSSWFDSALKAGTFMQPGSNTAIPVHSQRNITPTQLKDSSFPNSNFCPLRVIQGIWDCPKHLGERAQPTNTREPSVSHPVCPTPGHWDTADPCRKPKKQLHSAHMLLYLLQMAKPRQDCHTGQNHLECGKTLLVRAA